MDTALEAVGRRGFVREGRAVLPQSASPPSSPTCSACCVWGRGCACRGSARGSGFSTALLSQGSVPPNTCSSWTLTRLSHVARRGSSAGRTGAMPTWWPVTPGAWPPPYGHFDGLLAWATTFRQTSGRVLCRGAGSSRPSGRSPWRMRPCGIPACGQCRSDAGGVPPTGLCAVRLPCPHESMRRCILRGPTPGPEILQGPTLGVSDADAVVLVSRRQEACAVRCLRRQSSWIQDWRHAGRAQPLASQAQRARGRRGIADPALLWTEGTADATTFPRSAGRSGSHGRRGPVAVEHSPRSAPGHPGTPVEARGRCGAPRPSQGGGASRRGGVSQIRHWKIVQTGLPTGRY